MMYIGLLDQDKTELKYRGYKRQPIDAASMRLLDTNGMTITNRRTIRFPRCTRHRPITAAYFGLWFTASEGSPPVVDKLDRPACLHRNYLVEIKPEKLHLELTA